VDFKQYSKTLNDAKVQALNEIQKRRKGKTQAAVAVALGISQAYLSDIVNNRRDLTPKLMEKLLG